MKTAKPSSANPDKRIEQEIQKICRNIKNIRMMKGYSQENMAEELEMTQRNYGRIENGNTDLTVFMLYKICDVLGVDVSVIMNLRENLIMNNINHNQHNGHITYYNATEVKHIQELYERLLKEKEALLHEKERHIELLKQKYQ